MTAKSYDELLEQYLELCSADQGSEFELAAQEWALWETGRAAGEIPERCLARNWFAATFGGGSGIYEARRYLYRNARYLSELWSLLDAGQLKISTAMRLVRVAKQRPGPLEKSFSSVLYEWSGATRDTTEGPTQTVRSKSFLAEAERFARVAAQQLGEPAQSDAVDEFLLMIRAACAELSRRGSEHRRLRRRQERVGIKAAKRASEVLAVYLPRRVQLSDVPRLRREVQLAKNQRVRQLHPDLTGNDSPELAAELKAVLQSADLLEAYFKQQEEQDDG